MNVEAEIRRLRDECADRRKKIKWLVEHQKQLANTGVEVGSCVSDRVDFDNLPHKKVIAVIRALGGKWSKEPAGDNRINYEAEIGGMKVRCWQGEPPPSCRIVEVEETVPEVVIPAHVKKVRKMICRPHAEPLVQAALDTNALPKVNEVPF